MTRRHSGVVAPVYTFAFLTISFATTDVAIILSFGNEGFGLTIDRLLKLKFFKALAQAPIFSDN